MISSNYVADIINKFGNDYIINGSEYRYNCPFCLSRRGKADTDKKLYVNSESGLFHCFKCSANGTLGVKKKSSSDVYEEIRKYLSKNDSDDEDEDNTFYVPNTKLQKETLAYEYCLSRNITEDKIEYYDIRLGLNDLYGRIVIPNQVFGDTEIWTDMYSARSYTNQIPKYKNPKGANKSGIVFNLHRIEKGCDVIYGVEGVITAICAGKEAVAFYGCSPSNAQIRAVASKQPKEFYAILDNDEAGRAHIVELAQKMSALIDGKVFVVYLPTGIDASDLGEEKFKEYVRENRHEYRSGAYEAIYKYLNS